MASPPDFGVLSVEQVFDLILELAHTYPVLVFFAFLLVMNVSFRFMVMLWRSVMK